MQFENVQPMDGNSLWSLFSWANSITRRQQSDPPDTRVNNEHFTFHDITMCRTYVCRGTQPGRSSPHPLHALKGLHNFHYACLSTRFSQGWGRCIGIYRDYVLLWNDFKNDSYYHAFFTTSVSSQGCLLYSSNLSNLNNYDILTKTVLIKLKLVRLILSSRLFIKI